MENDQGKMENERNKACFSLKNFYAGAAEIDPCHPNLTGPHRDITNRPISENDLQKRLSQIESAKSEMLSSRYLPQTFPQYWLILVDGPLRSVKVKDFKALFLNYYGDALAKQIYQFLVENKVTGE